MVTWSSTLLAYLFLPLIAFGQLQTVPNTAEGADAERPRTMLEQLSPQNQLRVILGLFAVVILGVVIFMVIKAGAHMFRGFSAAANRLPHDTTPDEHDWAERPLNTLPKKHD